VNKIKKIIRKADKIIGLMAIRFAPIIRPGMATVAAMHFYGKWGMKFVGKPNYLSARINFDGTDYSLIEIHEGVTISSYVRVLTHDWSLYTIAKSVDHFSPEPIGKIKGVSIGACAAIGRGCLIGAGTVVRGNVPDYSIVIGSPGKVIGDTREHIEKQLARLV